MSTGEMFNRQVVICQADDSIQKAAELMRNNHVCDVVVTENRDNKDAPLGILTDKKIIDAAFEYKINLNDIAVKYMINNELLTIKEDDIIIDALKQMRDKGIRRIPVVNQEGGLEGILLEGDLNIDDENELIDECLSDLIKLFKHKFNFRIKIH